MKHRHAESTLAIPELRGLEADSPRDLAPLEPLLREPRRMLRQLLLGGPIVGGFLGLVCALGLWKHDHILGGIELGLVVAAVLGLPFWLFARANLRDLERLVRDGEAVAGVVESLSRLTGGRRSGRPTLVIVVSYETRDGLCTVVVPVPSHDSLQKSSDVVVMVHPGSPKVVGVFAHGQPDGALSFYLSMSPPRRI